MPSKGDNNMKTFSVDTKQMLVKTLVVLTINDQEYVMTKEDAEELKGALGTALSYIRDYT